MEFYDTLRPYHIIPYDGIVYGHCREYDHISRYRTLRQITHNENSTTDRFICLETPNAFTSQCEVVYYTVPAYEENRIDVIAYKFLGSAQYAWVIAYFNQLEDGFSVPEGMRLRIPRNISALFNKGEVLAPVSATSLNLGRE